MAIDLTDQFVEDYRALEKELQRLQSELETQTRLNADGPTSQDFRQDLDAVCQEYKETISHLEDQLEAASNEIRDLKLSQTSEEQFRTQINQLEKQLISTRNEATYLRNSGIEFRLATEKLIDDLNKKIGHLEKSLRATNQTLKPTFEEAFPELASELKFLRIRVREMESDAKTSPKPTSSFEKDYPQQAAELNRLQKQQISGNVPVSTSNGRKSSFEDDYPAEADELRTLREMNWAYFSRFGQI